jgi:glycosyltransferase involved in cell wall biosynthesis
MSEAEISVVVPVRDGADTLPALLMSLDRQTLPRERFEVIVVDNGSQDGSGEIAERMGARVVAEPARGRTRARNTGVASAKTDLIAFTDADCVAEPGWLEGFRGCSGSAPLLAGIVTVTTGDSANAVERFERLWRFDQEAWAKHLGWAATANLMVERGAFEEIGGFDDAYRHTAEDVDFCIRARDAGLRLEVCAAALVNHRAESRLWPMLKRSFWHGYGGVQAARRTGVGARAWAAPRPLLDSARAAAVVGIHRERVDARDWRSIRRLARAAYAMRVAGSAWADLSRVR